MSHLIRFKAKVLSNYRILIPKALVTRNQLWIGRKIGVIYRNGSEYERFEATIKSWFSFTIPFRSRINSRLKPREYTEFEIGLIDSGPS